MRIFWATTLVFGVLIMGCPPGSDTAVAPTETVTPVVVLPAPIDAGASSTAEDGADAAAVSPFEAEMQIMDGYEPLLKDASGDAAAGSDPAFDLVSVYAVATDESLMLRVASAEPMAMDHLTDVRLWIEQGDKLVTLEAKPDHPDRICELTPMGDTEGEELVGCLDIGPQLNIRVPLKSLPSWLNTREPYFVSGVSTCCADEGRERPFDEIKGAQEVWVFDEEADAETAPTP